MTHIEQMIQDLCPNGIEWKTIKETVGVNRGRRLTKSQLKEDGLYEVYHGSKDTPLGRYDDYNAPKDTIIIVNTGGIGGVKYLDKAFWCSDGSFWLGHSTGISNKFLYYFLSRYEDYFESQKRVGGCKRSCKRSCKCVVSSMSTIVPNYLRHTRIAILLPNPMIAIGNGKHWERLPHFQEEKYIPKNIYAIMPANIPCIHLKQWIMVN